MYIYAYIIYIYVYMYIYISWHVSFWYNIVCFDSADGIQVVERADSFQTQ